MLSISNEVLLTEVDAAVVISCSLSALQKSRAKKSTKIANGLAPRFIKDKGTVRYRLADLEQFVANLMSQDSGNNGAENERNETVAELAAVDAVEKKPVNAAFDWSTLK
ncbi:hypothetical protein AB4238_05015 [Shewanella sp. 10N.286.45.A1]|uniref:hypothetical protein n=1 Tax=Shewanella sp. 10N.286.45.A1 TaxID=3229694 RepID=UPI0035511054